MTEENIKQLVAMPFRRFVDLVVAWKEETETDLDEMPPTKCPVHQYAMQNGRCLDVTGGTELCPVCGNPMCPTCGSHCVEQLSRVTGYLSTVSNWGAAKQQEFKDRQRHTLPTGSIR